MAHCPCPPPPERLRVILKIHQFRFQGFNILISPHPDVKWVNPQSSVVGFSRGALLPPHGAWEPTTCPTQRPDTPAAE